MKKKVLTILLSFSALFSTAFVNTIPIQAESIEEAEDEDNIDEDEDDIDEADSDEDENDAKEETEDSKTPKKMSTYCSDNHGSSFEFLTTDLSKKSKSIKGFYSCEAYDSDDNKIPAKITYQVTKTDKYLSFSKNNLTIKKGITAGTHKIKVKITFKADGYTDYSETQTITVKIKKPRTSGSSSGYAVSDIGGFLEIPVDVKGTYKLTLSGSGAKKFDVYLQTSSGVKKITNFSKVTINPAKHFAFRLNPKKYDENAKQYKVKITLKKA